LSFARCSALIAWYEEYARPLPWRETHDPYAVWVSEIMLQQTQVKTVLPRYTAWLKRFPDISILARASLDDVLKAWEGLGYYRRARFMHASAQRIMTEHCGQFPRTYDDILKLPGIGRSTAGAIASFCFHANTPVLDGNVQRVLKRWHGTADIHGRKLWQWAHRTLDVSANPSCWNQAMMELGATICTPKAPDCAACPVSAYCAVAFKVRESAEKKKHTALRNVHWRVNIHLHPKNGIWFVRRPCSGIWSGLWTPPIDELTGSPGKPPCYIHLLTHRRLHLYGRVLSTAPTGKGKWVSDMNQIAIPTGIHRLLAKHKISYCLSSSLLSGGRMPMVRAMDSSSPINLRMTS